MKNNKESLSDYTKTVEDSDGETPPPAVSPPVQASPFQTQVSTVVPPRVRFWAGRLDERV